MKKILSIALVMIMLLSLAACKKDPPPVETVPPTTTPVETQPTEAPPEIIPDIEDETMPPALTDNMTGSELRKLYTNFMRDYNWSQHNGFTAETPSLHFTYIFNENGFIKDIKRVSELYEDSYVSRRVLCYKDGLYTEFLMCDAGSFGFEQSMEEAPPYPCYWNFYNENTKTEYVRTKVSDKVYDIINFETTWDNMDESLNYTVQDTATGDIYFVTVVNDYAYLYSVAAEKDIYENVFFDMEARTLTVENKTMNVEIVEWPEEHTEHEESTNVTLRGMLYVDRDTQTVVYMEDADRGTIVYFLTDAVINFTLPNSVKPDVMSQNAEIMYVMENFENDVRRYLTTESPLV